MFESLACFRDLVPVKANLYLNWNSLSTFLYNSPSKGISVQKTFTKEYNQEFPAEPMAIRRSVAIVNQCQLPSLLILIVDFVV